LAQANLDGGGNTDENRRAKTPLPPSPKTHEGSDLAEAQLRVAALEQQQRLMLAQTQKAPAPPQSEHSEQQPTPAPTSGRDLASSALALARLEAQISTSIDEYNKRPRKKFIGARTEEYRYAQYIEDWRQKIERIGNLNYPESARGHLYGSLMITVAIKSDGNLKSIEINRPSQHRLLDDAARRIVRLAAPFAPFPPGIREETDILEITRTWSFTSGDKIRAD
jgi:protein TonB